MASNSSPPPPPVPSPPEETGAGASPASATEAEREADKKDRELKRKVDEELDLGSFLEHLLAVNNSEIRKIKKTTDSFELVLKFLWRVMEEEEETMQRVVERISEIVRKEFGVEAGAGQEKQAEATTTGVNGQEPPKTSKLTRSASTVGRLLHFLGAMPENEEEEEAEDEDDDEAEDQDRASCRDSSAKLNLVPAFMLLASVVKELKQFNGSFGRLETSLAALELTQAEILEEQRNANAVAKGQLKIAAETLELKKEKFRRRVGKGTGNVCVCGSGHGANKGKRDGAPGGAAGSGSGLGLFKPCSSL